MTGRLSLRGRALLALGGLGLGGALLWLGPGHWGGLRLACPFYLLTGLPCPGCGMSRALVLLAQGRAWDALIMHPFSWLLAGAALAALPWLLWDLLHGRGGFFALWAKPWPKALQGALYAALAAVWLWNLSRF